MPCRTVRSTPQLIGVHDALPAPEVNPAGHAVHIPLPGALNVSAGQTLHEALPVDGAADPAGHAVQLVAPAMLEDQRIAHGRHTPPILACPGSHAIGI